MSQGEENTEKRQMKLPLFEFGLSTASAQAKRSSIPHFQIILHLAGFVLLVYCTLSIVDRPRLQSLLDQMSASTLVTMTVLHVVIILLTSWRFAGIVHAAGAAISLRDAIRLTFSATFANMLLPTSIAGDAGRVWLVHRRGLPLKSAVAIGVFDRMIGLASLGSVVLLGTILAPPLIPFWGVILLCSVCAVPVAFLLARWRTGNNLPDHGKTRPAAVVCASASLSIAAHLVSIAIAFVFLQDHPSSVGFGALLVLFPAVLLAASVPVSIGGWGTRELAAAGAFATVGLDPSIAIAMAFMFGVTQTAAAGLGTAFFLMNARARGNSDD